MLLVVVLAIAGILSIAGIGLTRFSQMSPTKDRTSGEIVTSIDYFQFGLLVAVGVLLIIIRKINK